MERPTITKKMIGEFINSLYEVVLLGTVVYMAWMLEYKIIAVILVILALSSIPFHQKSENP